MSDKHIHHKLKFCVSGAAETGMCSENALENGKTIGREIAKMGAVLVNGATSGFPYWAAIGAKEAGGFTIGISPAESEREHVDRYKLPLDYMDMVVYTGMGYSARNLLLTRTADAVIIGCGRIGTLNEFTVAFEDGKPIGILEEDGGTTNLLDEIIEASHRSQDNPNIVFEKDPKILLKKLTELVEKGKVKKD
ncbi:MAG: hypothetical protein O2794_00415 [bacterium]|nr:hypothetical protein [bacterium]